MTWVCKLNWCVLGMCCDLVTATSSKLLQVSSMHGRLDIVDYVLTEARLSLCVKHLVSHTCLVRTNSYKAIKVESQISEPCGRTDG